MSDRDIKSWRAEGDKKVIERHMQRDSETDRQTALSDKGERSGIDIATEMQR